jgi:phosphatidate cytidylyltransferase
MKNIYRRSLTGIVFLIVLVGSITLHPLSCFLLFSVIIFLGIRELYTIIEPTGIKPQKWLGAIAGVLLLLIALLNQLGILQTTGFWLMVPVVAVIFVSELYRKQVMPLQNIAFTLFGILYLAVPFTLLYLLGFQQKGFGGYSFQIILGYFFLLWTSDTGAYLTGISIGKHPMFARISPKKSWEGFAGGFILTIVVAIVVSHYYTALSTVDWMVIGGIVATFGVWGDLIESMLKRSLNIKDSGTLLPGHGGILDRFDSVLFSAPIVYAYMQLKDIFI